MAVIDSQYAKMSFAFADKNAWAAIAGTPVINPHAVVTIATEFANPLSASCLPVSALWGFVFGDVGNI